MPTRSRFPQARSALLLNYPTPLETMLRLGGVKTVIVTGFAADNCVLFTSADAYMREFRLVIPRDCVGAKTPAAARRALKTMDELFGARIVTSARMRLPPRR